MTSCPRKGIEERNAEIVAFLNANPNSKTEEVCRRFGVAPHTVGVIRRQHNLPQGRRGPTANKDCEVLSRLHIQIGRALFQHRRLVLHAEVTEAAAVFKMSRTCLVQAELGAYNFSLTQLQHLAEVLGSSLIELLTEKSVRLAVVA